MCRSRWRIYRSGSRASVALLLAMVALFPACRNTARAKEHVAKGNEFFSRKEFVASENEYRQAIEIDHDSADAYYRLGLLQLRDEHPTAASASFSRSIDLAPRNNDARLRLAELQIASTQYAEAKRQAEAVLQREGRNAVAHRLLGEIALHEDQYTAAEGELNKAIALAPQDPQSYEVLGLVQLLDSQYGAAEKTFQTAVEIKPDPQTYINLANFYKGQNKPDHAAQVLRQGIDKLPRAVQLPIALASLYRERNAAGEAKRLLDQIEADQKNYPEGRLAVANFLLENGNAASALERFRAIASGNGNDDDEGAAKKVAECYLQLGRWQDAEQWIRQRDPDNRNPDFRLLKARAYLGWMRLRDASSELQKLIKNSPDLPSVYFYLSQVYSAQEQPVQAQQALNDALRVQPGYLPALLGLANISLQQHNPDAALAYASRVIATSFWISDAHIIAGCSYLQQGDLNQAQRAFELAEGLNPRNPASYERLGQVLATRGDLVGAQKAYENALTIVPDYAPALNGLADALSKQGKAKQASARLDRQIALAPNAFQLYVAKAEFCISRNDWACAEHSYHQALAVNPSYVNGYLALAHVYAATNQPQQMIQEYESARTKFPEYLPAYILLAEVYEYTGNIDQGRETYQDALKVDPDSYQAMSNLARLYANHGGSLSDALELAQKAKELQTDDPGVNDTLGWIYYKQGLYRSAIPVLEAAATKSPQVAEFRFHLGMAYLAAGQPAQAHDSLQAALQAGLSGEDARSAREALQKAGS